MKFCIYRRIKINALCALFQFTRLVPLSILIRGWFLFRKMYRLMHSWMLCVCIEMRNAKKVKYFEQVDMSDCFECANAWDVWRGWNLIDDRREKGFLGEFFRVWRILKWLKKLKEEIWLWRKKSFLREFNKKIFRIFLKFNGF